MSRRTSADESKGQLRHRAYRGAGTSTGFDVDVDVDVDMDMDMDMDVDADVGVDLAALSWPRPSAAS
ncbi:hypothetical protein AB0H67_31020 [Streptomyces phaeochromogenes]|uniref:hypothetical protein n=1 Tax=Streptomyces phaeochromogenes TaxID=1923 RepID=UPI0033DF37AF